MALTRAGFAVPIIDPDTKQPLDALADLRLSGYVGGALPILNQQVPSVHGNPLRVHVGDPVGVSIGIPEPRSLQSVGAAHVPGYSMIAVNDRLVVLAPSQEPQFKAVDVFDKSQRAWHRIDLPFDVSRVRAFGVWLAAMRSEPRDPAWSSIKRTDVNAEELRRLRPSPGKAKRESTKVGIGRHNLVIDDLFERSTEYFPGDLVVIHALTGNVFTIHTGLGDSEVVLATDENVYYRVDDCLYRADWASGKLTAGAKVAEGPEIVQVHWAFLGPALDLQ